MRSPCGFLAKPPPDNPSRSLVCTASVMWDTGCGLPVSTEAEDPNEDFDERDHRNPVRRGPSSHHSARHRVGSVANCPERDHNKPGESVPGQ